jgi:hypothetical protein
MNRVKNEYFIVWEFTDDYVFHHMYEKQEQAEQHMEKRLKQIEGTEMEGRTLIFKRYVVLE